MIVFRSIQLAGRVQLRSNPRPDGISEVHEMILEILAGSRRERSILGDSERCERYARPLDGSCRLETRGGMRRLERRGHGDGDGLRTGRNTSDAGSRCDRARQGKERV